MGRITIEEFEEALGRLGLLGKMQQGRQRMARCPVHPDRTPSLSYKDDGNGVVAYCHGCKAPMKEIFKALDLWGNRSDEYLPAQWVYRDEDGLPYYADGRRPNPDGGEDIRWMESFDAAGNPRRGMKHLKRRLLYDLPEVIEAAKVRKVIWAAEGPAKVEALQRLGIEVATTVAFGKDGFRSQAQQCASQLVDAGVQDIVYAADVDEDGGGLRAAVDWYYICWAWGIRVTVVEFVNSNGERVSPHEHDGTLADHVELDDPLEEHHRRYGPLKGGASEVIYSLLAVDDYQIHGRTGERDKAVFRVLLTEALKHGRLTDVPVSRATLSLGTNIAKHTVRAARDRLIECGLILDYRAGGCRPPHPPHLRSPAAPSGRQRKASRSGWSRYSLATLAKLAPRGPSSSTPSNDGGASIARPSVEELSEALRDTQADGLAWGALNRRGSVLRVLRASPGLTVAKLAKAANVAWSTANTTLQRAEQAGAVKKDDDGGWWLVDDSSVPIDVVAILRGTAGRLEARRQVIEQKQLARLNENREWSMRYGIAHSEYGDNTDAEARAAGKSDPMAEPTVDEGLLDIPSDEMPRYWSEYEHAKLVPNDRDLFEVVPVDLYDSPPLPNSLVAATCYTEQ